MNTGMDWQIVLRVEMLYLTMKTLCGFLGQIYAVPLAPELFQFTRPTRSRKARSNRLSMGRLFLNQPGIANIRYLLSVLAVKLIISFPFKTNDCIRILAFQIIIFPLCLWRHRKENSLAVILLKAFVLAQIGRRAML